jgi:transcriptional regulator with XRE-family HTH domain
VGEIGENLRSLRARRGWSREALAYHSGVSWSAITQIESARRKDLRLSSLLALANALDVSVDYLVGTMSPPSLCEHRVLTYNSDDEFVAAAIPFLEDGIAQSHCLLVVTTEPKTGLLHDALDDRSGEIEFANWADWYSSPPAAVTRYREFVNTKLDAGATWIRVLAEAAWSGETEAEIAAWTRYESIVNLVFAPSPATLVCTYDERAFPGEVIADARRTHPEVTRGSDTTANSMYREPEVFLLQQ